jgi:hypothetical protein
VKTIEPPNTHHLSAALGWLGLGDVAEARAELALIEEGLQNHPSVLEARWLICAHENQWDEGLPFAQSLVKNAPDRPESWLHHAYTLRRAREGSVRKAWEALLPAFDKFPEEPIISFNLSCYACQMNDLDAARTWLKRALVIGGKEKIKRQALEDPDLKPLWEEIRSL